MNTYLEKLDTLIAEFPEEREALSRLNKRFSEDMARIGRTPEYPANRIFDVAKPRSGRALAIILARLCELGVLSKFVRVESDALGGIDDFDSVIDVPEVIFDIRQGREIEVRPDQLRLYYGLTPKVHENWTK